jgi:hypothetical protein
LGRWGARGDDGTPRTCCWSDARREVLLETVLPALLLLAELFVVIVAAAT